MQSQNRSTEGLTLIELLVALSLLMIILTLTFNTAFSAIKNQHQIQSSVSADLGLRRTLDVMTQDVRNSAYGLVTNYPNTSTASSISLVPTADTAVFPVIGSAATFKSALTTQALVNSGFSWPTGNFFLLVNPVMGQATVQRVTSDSSASSLSTVTISHSAAANTLCYDVTDIVQSVQPVGYSFDANSKIIYRNTLKTDGTTLSTPFVLGATNFVIGYIGTDNTTYTSLAAIPASVNLSRLSFTLTLQEMSGNSTSTKTLTSSVEIPKILTLTTGQLKYVTPGTSVTCS